jgi:phosphosulfolactate synthase
VSHPHFHLNLPQRSAKPRNTGLSCVIDNGYPFPIFEAFLEAYGSYVDFVKFGWGTSYIDPQIEQKIAFLRSKGIEAWLGGSLFEIAYAQGKLEPYIDWCHELGLLYFEISDGTITLDPSIKHRLIEKLSGQFRVLSEVGSKDAEQVMSPRQWIKHIQEESAAGAWKIITEGRESGTAGMFRSTGEVRFGLIQEIEESGLDLSTLIFEAPQKSQQVWFIKYFGHEVNLGNIALTDSLNLETLRQGLRSDTLHLTLSPEENSDADLSLSHTNP